MTKTRNVTHIGRKTEEERKRDNNQMEFKNEKQAKRKHPSAGEPPISPLDLQCSLLLICYLEWTERSKTMV